MIIPEGLEVIHKVFGNGIVEKVSGKYVTIRFANLQKVFVYPDAFAGFLRAADDAVSQEIEADIACRREQQRAMDAERRKAREVERKGHVDPDLPRPDRTKRTMDDYDETPEE